MKIVLLADITAGHILPILKLKEKFKIKYEVEVVAFDHKISRKLIKEGNFIQPFNSTKNYFSALKKFNEYDKNTIFLSCGGRITLLLIGLYFKGFKNLYSYELNAVFGNANSITYPFVKKMFTYFPYKKKKCVELGNPLEERFKLQPLNYNLNKILMLTGSNGSSEMFELAESISNKGYNITISTGISDYKFKSKIKTIGFIPSYLYKDFDFIIARSGAGTIADIINNSVPAIFLPSKNVKKDHQKKNVLALAKVTKIKYLDYNKQNEKEVCDLIDSYKDLRVREELVKSYQGFTHDSVIKRVIEEIEKDDK